MTFIRMLCRHFKKSQRCIGVLQVLVYLMLALHSPALVADRLTALNILHALMSNTKIVKEALNKGKTKYIIYYVHLCIN